VTVSLVRPMVPYGVTVVDYRDKTGIIHRGRFTAHPGNVNGDDVVDADDLAALLDALNGKSTPVWGLYSTDIDRSGSLSPGDVLRLVDLLGGGDAYAPGWRGTARPVGVVDQCAH